MAPSAATIVDMDGDLRLRVGTEEREFVVCSRSLSRASPVFKCMLYGSFQESKPTDGSTPWVVHLPEDNGDAAELLLNAAHARFDRIPETLPLNAIYDALVFSDKYDMTRLLQPWIISWLPLNSELLKSESYAVVLGVSWELGNETVFMHVAKRLCLECGVDAEGQLVDAASVPVKLDIPLIPPWLVGEY